MQSFSNFNQPNMNSFQQYGSQPMFGGFAGQMGGFQPAQTPAFGGGLQAINRQSQFGQESGFQQNPMFTQQSSFVPQMYSPAGQIGTNGAAYHPTNAQDQPYGTIVIANISAMKEFQNKSQEELRYEDWQLMQDPNFRPQSVVGGGFGNTMRPAGGFGATNTTMGGFGTQAGGFGGQNLGQGAFRGGGFGMQTGGFSQQAGFGNQMGGFGQQAGFQGQPGAFGNQSGAFGTQNNLFGQTGAQGGMFGSQQAGFGQATAFGGQLGGIGNQPGGFGGQTGAFGMQNTLFGQQGAQGSSLFGGQASGQRSLFGGSQGSFGQTTTFGGQQGGFGGQPTGFGGQSGAFGMQNSLFGQQGGQGSLFGGQANTQGSLFGGSQGGFGQAAAFGGQLGGLGNQPGSFGAQTGAFGTQSNLFGQQGGQGSLFGGQQGGQGSLFGGQQGGQGSLFGGNQGGFGQATAFGGQLGGIGNQPGTLGTQSPLFGQSGGQGSLFGGQTSGQRSLFGGSQGSFGQAAGGQQGSFGAQAGAFGMQRNVLGQTAGQSSMFGQNQPTGLFGQQSAQPYGNQGSSLFGNQGAGRGSIFAPAQQPFARPSLFSQGPFQSPQAQYNTSPIKPFDNQPNFLPSNDVRTQSPSRVTLAERLASSNNPPASPQKSPMKLRQEWDRISYTPKKSENFRVPDQPLRRRNSISQQLDAPKELLSKSHSIDLTQGAHRSFEILLQAYTPHEVRYRMKVRGKTQVSEIKAFISRKLPNSNIRDIELTFSGNKLNDDCSIQTIGLKPLDIIHIGINTREILTEIAPPDELPRMESNSFSTSPPFIEIVRMSINQLKAVKDFTIENEHGKIIFEGLTDLRKIDIDQTVIIREKSVNVYPDRTKVPEVGKGLNKPAFIHLYNCRPAANIPKETYRMKLESMCKIKGCKFISWNEDTFEWVFKVPHF